VPRIINVLMHKALLLAYGEGRWIVERKHVRIAISDTPAAAPLARWWWRWTSAAPRTDHAT